MTLVAAIHVPEKYGSRLAFIDDFGRRSKKASESFGWLLGKRPHRERVVQRSTPSLPRSGGEGGGEAARDFLTTPLSGSLPARSSRGESVFSHASTRFLR